MAHVALDVSDGPTVLKCQVALWHQSASRQSAIACSLDLALICVQRCIDLVRSCYYAVTWHAYHSLLLCFHIRVAVKAGPHSSSAMLGIPPAAEVVTEPADMASR